MYICYLDESGTAESGGTDHFVYAGIAIPAHSWSDKDSQVVALKEAYGLQDAEIHTGWMNRRYYEQEKIDGFEAMSRADRRKAVEEVRVAALARMRMTGGRGVGRRLVEKEKNFRKTWPYVHLTLSERREALLRIAEKVRSWEDSRIFFDCICKSTYNLPKSFAGGLYREAFHQVVTRFQWFLEARGEFEGKNFGLLVSDNNESRNTKLTQLMRRFYKEGAVWKKISNIVETPLFVDSHLTSMIQIADIVAYAIRRYCDKGENWLLDIIWPRFDWRDKELVGGRHLVLPKERCDCKICRAHRYRSPNLLDLSSR